MPRVIPIDAYPELFHASPVSMMTFDFDSAFGLEFNPACQSMFGYGSEEVRRLKGRDLHAGSLSVVADVSRRLHEDGKFEGRVELRKKCGQPFWGDLSISVVRMNGRTRLFDIVRDVTSEVERENAWKSTHDALLRERDELAAEIASLRADRTELERYTSRVAHDLLAPVRHVQFFAEELRDVLGGYGAGDLAVEAINGVRQGVTRMSRSINTLLELARARREGVRSQKVDLSELLLEVQALFERTAHARGIQFRHHCACNEVDGHAGALFVLLQNLVDNAIKYGCTSPAPMITLEARSVDDGVELRVSDNGAGVKDDSWQDLVGYFERGDDQSRGAGLGIGLSTCKQIIDLHAGELRIESLDPGTAFVVHLPNSRG